MTKRRKESKDENEKKEEKGGCRLMINGGVNHRARESKLQLSGRADCIDSYDGNVSRIVRRYFLWRPPTFVHWAAIIGDYLRYQIKLKDGAGFECCWKRTDIRRIIY